MHLRGQNRIWIFLEEISASFHNADKPPNPNLPQIEKSDFSLMLTVRLENELSEQSSRENGPELQLP